MSLDFEVTELPETDYIDTGDEAPDFTRPLVNDEYWEDKSVSELVPCILVFYPMNGAFQATYIWNEIRDREWSDEIDIYGVTISTPYHHKEFIRDREIESMLFSDPSNKVAEIYGVENNLDGMNGVTEPRPAVYIINSEMEVEYAWVAEEHPEFPPYDEIEQEL